MTVIRAALIVLIAFSVALVPIAGAKAHGLLPGSSVTAAHSDCCPQGKDCDKQEKGDCAKLAACALKCSSLTAATLEGQTAASMARCVSLAVMAGDTASEPVQGKCMFY